VAVDSRSNRRYAEEVPVNTATLLFDGSEWEEPPDAADAFRRAWPALDRLRREALARGGQPRLAMVGVHADGTVATAEVPPDGFAVLGRHTRCDLVLDDPGLSLRHLVAHWTGGPTPTVRLWDLRTAQPFVTEDGRSTSSVVAEGMLFCSVGPVALLFVPLEAITFAMDADDAWSHLPQRRFATLRPAREHAPRRSRGEVTITHTLPPLVFGVFDPEPGRAVAELSLEVPGGRAVRRVSEEQLDRGLLFGRYERCQLSLDTDGWLSRVHLLVVRFGGRVWAIDTASTNGTRHNGVLVSALALGTHTRLALGRSCLVGWQVLPDAPASSLF
jgi:hypothetical protein